MQNTSKYEILALKKKRETDKIVKILEQTIYDNYSASEYFAIYKILKPLMYNTQRLHISTRISSLMERLESFVFYRAMRQGNILDVVLFLKHNAKKYSNDILCESLINKKYKITRYICECNKLNKYINYREVLKYLSSRIREPTMFLYVFDICRVYVTDIDIASAVRSLLDLFNYISTIEEIDILYINISTVMWYIKQGYYHLRLNQNLYYNYQETLKKYDGYAEQYFTKLAMLNFLTGTGSNNDLLDTRKLLWELVQFV